jgi:PAS domain S-box-containing protein
MTPSSSRFSAKDESLQVLWQDGERVFCRRWRPGDARGDASVLTVLPAVEHPSPASLERLAHEYRLKNELDGDWAVLPLELVHESGHAMLVLEDTGGEPLVRLLGAPMEMSGFLRLAVGIAEALGKAHRRGLVHKDVKPGHILVNCADGRVRLTGFGIASRMPRERQALEPPETIAGTLAYMAPEQTGRMNRSMDSRSDLYSLGVTFYQMLTGALPFTASDPMEWVHCHIARQPLAPSQRLENIPAPVSGIIMKLLAKTAEERYQTAAGVASDLRRCLAEWDAPHRIDDFPLGRHDIPDQLLIPEKLYGRAREVETLLAAFDRIVKGGAPELVLVSGYSGIGKSSVVNELHKALVPPRGLFASGKFDQYKRDIPYSTLVQAFQSLVRPLLGKSDTELASWRGAFVEALSPNAGLITELIPDLKLIIGDQPPVPELEPQQVQSRFQLVLRRFIGVFARPEHPLSLFLDDLQWLDGATLDLLEDLLTRSGMQHLMLIGAYRNNEVDAAHPMMRKLDAIRQTGARVQEIHLASLARDDLGQLIADALRCDLPHVVPLAQLVQEKSAGNPFFVIQFLYALAEEGLLRFNHDAACWSWDLDRIHAKGYTDNVVDLMVGKLNRLPMETQQALQQLACLGNVADIARLSIVLGMSGAQVDSVLRTAVRMELVERLEGSYKFIHDRVQEAAYSLIPELLRAEIHLRIGRLLVAQTPAGQLEEAIFEIVNQFNRGVALITEQEERDRLAELNLLAGKRAKASTAYASALTYLNASAALLTENSWEGRHELVFALELNRAESEFLTGQVSVADERLAALSKRATTTVEQAFVACLHMDVCTTLDQSGRAVAVCLEYLRHAGIEWSPHPTQEDVRREYERIWSMLGSRTIEDLIDLPLMEDAASLATVEVLSKVLAPAVFTDANLAALTICKGVSLSLEFGNCDASCVSYVLLGRVAGPCFGEYTAGFRFGKLGSELVERRGLKRFEASTYHCFAVFVVPWMEHVRGCRDLIHRAFAAANRIGNLTFAAYACNNQNSALLFAGEPLADGQAEVEHGLAFAEKARFGLIVDCITTQLALIRMLRGLTPRFGCFDGTEFNETRFESHLSSNPVLAIAACWYWIRKLQARYIAGEYATAIDAASKAQRLLWTTSSLLEEAEYHFYGALSHAAYCDSARLDERQQHIAAMAAHHRQLHVWAENCPENFRNRADLVGAEIARIEGRVVDAMDLYEQAILSAGTNGFIHNEALANELAFRFYRGRGHEKIARVYLQDARHCYLRWGADGKVRHLEQMHPQLGEEMVAPHPTTTIATPVEHLDLATVIKVSEAVSGEIVLEKMLDTLMRTAITQAGAERGLLILSRAAEPRVAAQATTFGEMVLVEVCDAPVIASVIPETVLHYVLRTRQSVILDDAATEPSFAADDYIRQRQARSILCLPLINQAKLIGALYLENNLTPGAFAPARMAVLKLLASQASIALENTRLYHDLAEREAKIRRLVDSNILGICISTRTGDIIETNDAFLKIVGYDREDFLAGRVRWMDLTTQESLDRSERAIAELGRTGTFQPFEKEYFRKDGSRVPVLVGGAAFDSERHQLVAFVLDLTELKRTEQALRESEAKVRRLVDSNIIGVFEWHIEGRITEANHWRITGANEAFLQMVGYDREDLVSGRLRSRDMTPPEWRAATQRTLDDLAIAGTVRPYEKEYFRKDGTRVPVLIGAATFEKAKNQGVAFVLDLTERKRAEAEARESERMRMELAHANRVATMGQISASIAHEVNQPIAATVTNAQAGLRFLGARAVDLNEVQRILNDIVRDQQRAGEVIGRIRDLIEKAPPRRDRLEINGAIREVVELTWGEAGHNGVSVQTELADPLPVVQGDRVQLQQVILNLIINAIQAMGGSDEGPRELLISTKKLEAGVLVMVRDTGPGLAPAALDRVFESFYTTKPSGMGLGLSICRSIVEAHGGQLWASANEPRGAVFQFTLPTGSNDS